MVDIERNYQLRRQLYNFLLQKGWRLNKVTKRHDVFKPPTNLGFVDDYKLWVFNRIDSEFYEEQVNEVLKIL